MIGAVLRREQRADRRVGELGIDVLVEGLLPQRGEALFALVNNIGVVRRHGPLSFARGEALPPSRRISRGVETVGGADIAPCRPQLTRRELGL